MSTDRETLTPVFGDASLPLSGQPAVVTGASAGIGRSVALALAKAGADVAIDYSHHAEPAEELAHQITALGRKAIVVKADVSLEEEVHQLYAKAIEAFGTVHVSVSNAGVQKDAAFLEMSLQDWRTVIDINLTGQFLCARAAAREFTRRGVDRSVSAAAGKIISMSSVHDAIPWAGHANYAASKGGISMLMKTLAQELAPKRIRVNMISPGAIRTSINQPAWETPEAYEKLMELVPYGRIGEPEDIGRAAVWLASDASDYVVGATLYVDGGMMLYPEFASGG